jgi:hypothetical protein
VLLSGGSLAAVHSSTLTDKIFKLQEENTNPGKCFVSRWLLVGCEIKENSCF